MLITLPTSYGSLQTHAVRPGSNDLVLAADEQRRDAEYGAVNSAWVWAFIVGLTGAVLSVLFSPALKDYPGLVIGSFVLAALASGGTWVGIYYWKRDAARLKLTNAVEDHVRVAYLLDSVFQSGDASDEAEWEAAGLAHEASDLSSEAWRISRDPHTYYAVRLSPERAAEVKLMEKRASQMRLKVSRLLDPHPRQSKKLAVVG